ncbi:MAG: hypothetical protein R3C56_38655 [Pirellulaceae bacterium]
MKSCPQLENPGPTGSSWKCSAIADASPDPVATIEACKTLVADGFQVLCYTSDDPIVAPLERSRCGLRNACRKPHRQWPRYPQPKQPTHHRFEYLKEDDPAYPVIVDAGVGTASDVTIAFELGADGVLLNSAIAHAARSSA